MLVLSDVHGRISEQNGIKKLAIRIDTFDDRSSIACRQDAIRYQRDIEDGSGQGKEKGYQQAQTSVLTLKASGEKHQIGELLH